MGVKCEICNRNFSSEESLNQHNSMKHRVEEKKGKVGFKKYLIIGIIFLIIIFGFLSAYNYTKKPGNYDGFAKCLTENGVVIYGNDFCSYTANQLGMFGKSKKYLDYVKCINNEVLCDEKGVKTTPTWWIKDYKLEGVQSFERLSELSGCEI